MSYKDFDKFFEESEESNKIAVSIKLFGKVYTLPTEVSAVTVLLSYKATKEGRAFLDKNEEIVLMFELLGNDNIEEWIDLGMSEEHLYSIFKWVLMGCPDDPEDQDENEKK